MLMKKTLLFIPLIALLLMTKAGISQTTGTLNFTATIATQSSSYNNKHFVAIWIEDNAGTFIKTKNRFGSVSNSNNHLCQWKNKSASNLTDATTGATVNSYTIPVTMATWNGTNVAGANVADGTYKVWIETCWDDATGNCGTQGVERQWTSLSFTKGSSAVHLTGQVSTIFTMTLDWVPATSGIESNDFNTNISFYPNPTNGFLNFDLSQIHSGSVIQIHNIVGKKVFEEKLEQLNGVKTIDMSNFENGIYLVSIQFVNENKTYKVVLNK